MGVSTVYVVYFPNLGSEVTGWFGDGDVIEIVDRRQWYKLPMIALIPSFKNINVILKWLCGLDLFTCQ